MAIEPFTNSELRQALNHFPQEEFDEIEVLLSEQEVTRVTFRDGGPGRFLFLEDTSLMLTAIRSGVVFRRSWSAGDRERLLNSIPSRSWSEGWASPPEYMNVRLNRPGRLGLSELPSMTETESSDPETLSGAAQDLHRNLKTAWPNLYAVVFLEGRSESRGLANTHGLVGSYRRGSVRSAVLLTDPTTFRQTVRRGVSIKALSGLPGRCEEDAVRLNLRLPRAKLQGGACPVLLSPAAVALLCLRISSFLRLESPWEASLSGAFPKDFGLTEDPFMSEGPRRAPFDDEGTPTRAKCLLKGGERLHPISDLRTAAAFGETSTGNGFRRGTFLSHPSECVPVACPSQLCLAPGAASVADVLREHSECLWIESISMPFSQIMDANQPKDIWTVRGKYFLGGKPAAEVIETRFTGRPIVSARPMGSHGSLLDRKSIVLREGELLESGWYPYMFVPCVRW